MIRHVTFGYLISMMSSCIDTVIFMTTAGQLLKNTIQLQKWLR